MFLTPAAQIGALIMTLVCLFAAWAGGKPQKVIALTAFVAWVLSAAIEDRGFHGPQYSTFVLDMALMVLWVWLALVWKRPWLGWVAAFQCLTMATHIAGIIDPRIWPLASITAYMTWSYLTLVAIAWGGVEGLIERRRAAAASAL